MGKDNIEKYSTRYALFKQAVAFWHDNVFYRKIIVRGAENINPDEHLIFAPNHQNALMDALAVLFTHKGQPVFLATEQIFSKSQLLLFIFY
jgi:1-acyl-sn-glycerol-3-phosphate acyltransferase